MKTVSVALANYYATQEVTTLATIWAVILSNGVVRRFTDLDRNIDYLGNTFISIAGYTATDVQTNASLAVNNLEVSGFVIDPYINEDEINSGLWDNAAITIQELNYLDLSMGVRDVRTGTIGAITHDGRSFKAELRGRTQLLQRPLGNITTASCRYDLGDTKCLKDLTNYTITGLAVSADISAYSFTAPLSSHTVQLTPSTTGAPTDNYFQGGKVLWLTGANAGLISEVDENVAVAATNTVTLVAACYYTIQPGDTFTIIAGCNKILKTGPGSYLGDCKIKFGNAINFGGEPEMPGESSQAIGGQNG